MDLNHVHDGGVSPDGIDVVGRETVVNQASQQLSPAAPQAVEPDPFDFNALLQRCLDNMDLAERLVDKFQQQCASDIETLQVGVESQNADTIARSAHRIKGAASTLSADPIVRAAARIEKLGRSGKLDEVPQHLESLRREWSRFLEYSAGMM